MSDPDTPPGAEHLAGAAEAPDLAQLRARLQGQLPEYQVLTCLGRGGMGAVFRAHHMRLDRPVAVKVLLPAPEAVQGWEERFLREARALARLAHPGILTIYDYGQIEGLSWIVMEFVDGASLRELMGDGRLGPSEALAIVPQICDALQYAHDHGVVHRDIKPENILLDEGGRVRIADFGLAKLMNVGPSMQLTGSAQAMGTLRYMAPEQLERPKEVDHRADIFSLGIVFYEMLTGRVPAGAVQPPSAEGCTDARLDEVVMKSMERDPGERYQRADEVVERLEELRETPAREPSVPPVPPVTSTEDAHHDASLVRSRTRMISLVTVVLAFLSLNGKWDDAPLLGSGRQYKTGFETGMGVLTAVILATIGLLLLALSGHRRGRTAAALQVLVSPMVFILPGWHKAHQYLDGDEFPMMFATMGAGAVLVLLGLVQFLVRSPDEPSVASTLRRCIRRVSELVRRYDLWRWGSVVWPLCGVVLTAVFMGTFFRESRAGYSAPRLKPEYYTFFGGTFAALALTPVLTGAETRRRIGTKVQVCVALSLACFMFLLLLEKGRGTDSEFLAPAIFLSLLTVAVALGRLVFSRAR